MTRRGHVYTPATTKNYETQVFLAAQRAGAEAHLNPCSVTITAEYPIPTSKPVWWRSLARAGFIPRTIKPDVDNISKSILDGLNGAAYMDDSQVYDLHVRKIYSDTPCVDVLVQYYPILTKDDYSSLED